jgi:hypothetical protein
MCGEVSRGSMDKKGQNCVQLQKFTLQKIIKNTFTLNYYACQSVAALYGFLGRVETISFEGVSFDELGVCQVCATSHLDSTPIENCIPFPAQHHCNASLGLKNTQIERKR